MPNPNEELKQNLFCQNSINVVHRYVSLTLTLTVSGVSKLINIGEKHDFMMQSKTF